MRLIEKTFANVIFSLHILLAFFLLAGDRLEFPSWLQVVGRSHPLVLHLPIGILVMVGLIWLFRKRFQGQDVEDLVRLTLYVLSFTAVITALAGFVLTAEGGYDEGPLFWHRLTGVTTSFLCWSLFLVDVHLNSNEVVFATLLWTSVGVVVVTGHFGGSLTHGDGYLFRPLTFSTDDEDPVTDSTTLYNASVRRVLSAKCFSCHNEKKRKGDLVMTSERLFAKGGENGSPWAAGDPHKSILVERITLPEEDDDHMPPSGKSQLTASEVRLISLWIEKGPDFSTPWTRYPHEDSLYLLTRNYVEQHSPSASRKYTFAFASFDVVERLNTPYRTVTRIAESEPALRAEFFSALAFRPGEVQELTRVSSQLVDLSLNRMPVAAEDLKAVRALKELERLNLNYTGIDGAAVEPLLGLSKLRSLSVVGSKLSSDDLRQLAGLESLREVKYWGTPISVVEAEQLRKDFPLVDWDAGYIPDENERLRLTPPALANEDEVLVRGERVKLKSSFPGVTIRYSLDGIAPDSITSNVYRDPFAIGKHTLVRAAACKEGWYCSSPADFSLFIQGTPPDSASLVTLADKDYRAEGALTLIDGKKGSPSNYRDGAWVAYRQQPMEALFFFDNEAAVKSVTVSFAVNVSSYLMPPASLELWGGPGPTDMQLIERSQPTQPKVSVPARIETVTIPLRGSMPRCYKLVVRQVEKLPAWHPGKGQRGWVFVDEVFFDVK